MAATLTLIPSGGFFPGMLVDISGYVDFSPDLQYINISHTSPLPSVDTEIFFDNTNVAQYNFPIPGEKTITYYAVLSGSVSDFSYITEDWTGGAWDETWWHPDMSGAFPRTIHEIGSTGEYYSKSPAGKSFDFFRLTPTGFCLPGSGQWSIISEIYFGPGGNTGNVSEHLRIKDSDTDAKLCDLWWMPNSVQYDSLTSTIQTNSYATWAEGGGIELKLESDGTETIYAYYKEPLDLYWTPLGSVPNATGCYFVDIEGSDGNGIDKIHMQGESGLLPYSDSTTEQTGTATSTICIEELTDQIYGKGSISSSVFLSNKRIDYPPASGRPIWKVMLTNTRVYPYRIPADNLFTKIEVYKNRKISYVKDIPIELELNYEGDWSPYASGVTNDYGMVYLTYDTTPMPKINCCLGVAKAVIDEQTYYSNIVRFNFVEGDNSRIILNAGTCQPQTDILINSGEGIYVLNREDYLIYERK